MGVGKERASARYLYFSIEMTPRATLRVDYEYPASTVKDGLTFFPHLTPGCKSIFEAPYDPIFSCHKVSPFGKYGSSVPGQGIHWGPWFGNGISLDFIEMRFRKRGCDNVSGTGNCSACGVSKDKRIDEWTGWRMCHFGITTQNCVNPNIIHFPSNTCILPN